MSSLGKSVVAGALQAPRRNRYFYGKQLDVRHFELEQEYFNSKRWLLNRLVSGFGTVCGLAVVGCDDDHGDAVMVQPGLGIDRWGREILVGQNSRPVKIAPPAAGTTKPDEENFIHLCIEYLECETDPAPVLASECNGGQRCMPDTIQERYKITVRPGRAPSIGHRCQIPDLTEDNTGQINYAVMAKWVCELCPPRPDDPCIALAEIEFDEEGECSNIDNMIRPIVYTNDLLFEMIMALTEQRQSARPGGKY